MTPDPNAFRALHERAGHFVIPNPWDAGSALMLQSLGFEALATSSAALAWTLGKRDGEVTLEEKLAHCRALTAAVSVPVSADLGFGFGDSPEAVARTITLAGDTGLAGGSIEDAPMAGADHGYDFALAVERVAAAVEAARALPHDFVLTARCEHFLWGRTDLDAVLKRLSAFEAAGADVLFAPGVSDLEMIRTMCASLSKPVNVLTAIPGLTANPAALAEAGVKRLSIGGQMALSAYGAALEAAQELKETGLIRRHGPKIRTPDLVRHFP